MPVNGSKYAEFDSGAFPLSALLLLRADGGWHITSVWYREGDGPVHLHPQWNEGLSFAVDDKPETAWKYLSERLIEVGCGNFYSYDVEGFETDTLADAEAFIHERAAEIVGTGLEPAGGLGGLLTKGHDSILPCVIEADEHGESFLVPTGLMNKEIPLDVCRADGTQVEPQDAGSLLWPSLRWPLTPAAVYLISHGGTNWTLVVDDHGKAQHLDSGLDPNWKPENMMEATEDVATNSNDGPQPYRVTREHKPRPPSGDWDHSPDQPTDADIFGGQFEWCFAVPWVFRTLASPRSLERMPAAPTRSTGNDGTDQLEQSCGYWNCLLYLLTYSFGWSRPDLGFKWWLDNDKPVDDPRFQLISEVWGADGYLDWFAAFLFSEEYKYGTALSRMANSFHSDRVDVDRRWIDEQKRAEEMAFPVGPFGKHLSIQADSHSGGATEEPKVKGHMLRSGTSHRRAVFTTDSMWGWYRSLDQTAATFLPDHPKVDWKVDAVVRPVGWLGTYRKSSKTGLWFSGRHRFHSIGN